MKNKLPLFYVISLAILVLSGCLAPVGGVPTPTPWPTPPLSEQATYVVSRGTIVDRFQLLGDVAPLVWEPLSFQTGGQLAALYVQEGDMVATGDLLAEFAMPDLLTQLDQARLSLSQAEDRRTLYANNQRFDLERAQLGVREAELLLQQVRDRGDGIEISLHEVRLQLAQLTVSEVESRVDPTLAQEVTKAQLAVDGLNRQVEDRRIRAPFAGQIAAIGVDLNSLRSPPQPPQPRTEIAAYTPLLVLAEAQPLRLIVSSESNRVTELAVGQPVTVTHRWAQNEPFTAQVVALPTLSTGDRFQPGFPGSVQLEILGDHPPLHFGEYVTIDVVAAIHQDTLLLPDAAIRRFGGRTFVVLEDGDRQRRVDVRTGLENGGLVEVLEGLQDGDVVVGR